MVVTYQCFFCNQIFKEYGPKRKELHLRAVRFANNHGDKPGSWICNVGCNHECFEIGVDGERFVSAAMVADHLHTHTRMFFVAEEERVRLEADEAERVIWEAAGNEIEEPLDPRDNEDEIADHVERELIEQLMMFTNIPDGINIESLIDLINDSCSLKRQFEVYELMRRGNNTYDFYDSDLRHNLKGSELLPLRYQQLISNVRNAIGGNLKIELTVCSLPNGRKSIVPMISLEYIISYWIISPCVFTEVRYSYDALYFKFKTFL